MEFWDRYSEPEGSLHNTQHNVPQAISTKLMLPTARWIPKGPNALWVMKGLMKRVYFPAGLRATKKTWAARRLRKLSLGELHFTCLNCLLSFCMCAWCAENLKEKQLAHRQFCVTGSPGFDLWGADIWVNWKRKTRKKCLRDLFVA